MRVPCFLALALIIMPVSNIFGQYRENNLPLVPRPRALKLLTGTFTISPVTQLVVNTDVAASDAGYFSEYLKKHYGLALSITRSKHPKKNAVNVFTSEDKKYRGKDAYSLSVENDKVILEGNVNGGTFSGLQTLVQLLPPARLNALNIPCLFISDSARFSWRGMHLDVSRHFFNKEEIKKYLDDMALFKYNTFHWHLTDDQGWRIEIKKYPQLTQTGAWRNGTLIGHYSEANELYDTIRYGGFYTRDDVREIVSYAAKRHITIVPEIEMPGHALAALAAYPWLACSGDSFQVARSWGVFKDVFCPSERTFGFIDDVLKEVSEMFPGQYIHIGGDECPKDRWRSSPLCREIMATNHLKNEEELQGYFTERVEKILHKYGKRLIGWDEILEGGLSPDATVMSWRGNVGGMAAARLGHDVVMTPTNFCYFDYYQSNDENEPLAIGGYLPLEKVYQFDPVPVELNESESKHILGGQANIWTEYIPEFRQVEYMAFPRMCALSEVLWSDPSGKDYDAFITRLTGQMKWFDFLGINYSKALYDIQSFSYPGDRNEGLSVELSTTCPGATVHYTLDGSDPVFNSPVYSSRINFTQSTGITAEVFTGSKPSGRIFKKLFRINNATGREVTLAHPPNEEYCRGGGFSLVNGVTGSLPWKGSEWLGFLKDDLDITIDLGAERPFTKIGVDALKDESNRIYFPVGIMIYTSPDGKNFSEISELDSSSVQKFDRLITVPVGNQRSRWVRIVAKNRGICKNENGQEDPVWLFVDEVSVE